MSKFSAVGFVVFLAVVLAAPGAQAQMQTCQTAVYTPTATGMGMNGSIMITFSGPATCNQNLMTYAAANPYSQNVTSCSLLGGALIGNSMFTLQAMATAAYTFPKRCSWYLKVDGNYSMMFNAPCGWQLICRMRVPTNGVGLPIELMGFSVDDADGLPVELMEFSDESESEEEQTSRSTS